MTDPFMTSGPRPNNQPKQPQQQSQSNPNARVKVKRGSKVSVRAFLIGCVFFGLFFLLIISLGLVYVIQNPTVLEGMGLQVGTVKNLLMMFAIIFFGLLFFAGVFFLVVNIYRLMSVSHSKAKYTTGALIGFLVIAIGIGAGAYSIIKIRELDAGDGLRTNDLVEPYVVSATDSQEGIILPSSEIDSTLKGYYIDLRGVTAIAPVDIYFKLNKENFGQYIGSDVENIRSMTLDCGNNLPNSTITAGPEIMSVLMFNGRCLYDKKGTYNLKLTYTYYDRNNRTERTDSIDVRPINIQSQVEVDVVGGDPYTIKSNQINVGTAPVTLEFNANEVFADLSLATDNIKWDLDGDLQTDETSGVVGYTYPDSGWHKINYQLPDIDPEYWNTIRIRVEGGRRVTCTEFATFAKGDGSKYSLQPKFPQGEQGEFSKYKYNILYADTGQQIDERLTSRNMIDYNFPLGERLQVEVQALDSQNNIVGFCKSDVIDTTASTYEIDTLLKVRRVGDERYHEITYTGNQQIAVVEIVPSDIQLQITNIYPPADRLQKIVKIDGVEVRPVQEDIYEFKITDEKDKELEITVKDQQGREATKTITLTVDEKPIVARMNYSPQNGESPLKVTLDASISEMNDPDDEIIHFSWDFGDGKTMPRTSEGVVEHIYAFSEENEGEFYPSVTVKTKKGYTDTIKADEPILVKRKLRNADIQIPSHPGQRAYQGETVEFFLETDGMVESIHWDFGNGKTYTCESRECATTTTVYDSVDGQEEMFDVRVNVEYKDHPSITATKRIKIVAK